MTDKIIQVINEVLEIEVDASASQETCEKWDSLRHLNIIVALEEVFEVSFEPEEIAVMKDVITIKRMIQQKNNI